MKFEDILFLISTGTAAVAAAGVNPLLVAGLSGAQRLIKIGHDAYVSGRERGEWTAEQEDKFDKEVLPTITSQPWWKNTPPSTGE